MILPKLDIGDQAMYNLRVIMQCLDQIDSYDVQFSCHSFSVLKQIWAMPQLNNGLSGESG